MSLFPWLQIPADFLAYQQEIGSREGAHYYYQNGHKELVRHAISPSPGVVGFTCRIFAYKDIDKYGAKVAFWWRRDGFAEYHTEVNVEDDLFVMGYEKHTGFSTVKSNIKIVKGQFFSAAVRIRNGEHLAVFADRTEFNHAWMKNTLSSTWSISVASGVPMLSMHLTNELHDFPYNYWKTQGLGYPDIFLKLGAIGIYTCKIVDNSAKNAIYINYDQSNTFTGVEFNHGSLPNGTIVYYTIRLMDSQIFVSSNFDNQVHRLGRRKYSVVFYSTYPNPDRLVAQFSSALLPLNFECEVPHHPDQPVN